MDLETNQEQYLEEARVKVKEQGYYMRRSLESANLRQALIHSARMLNVLSTSLLNPKNYYSLFMQVFDELNVLEKAFRDEHKRGRSMRDLYQAVQYCQQIIPRLYLLITVACVYIETFDVKAKDILQDLIEMTKGVQHPIRGLFLRYYFLKVCKTKFPDKGNEYEGDGGTVKDSINLIMINLKEMNRLWIRIKSIRSFKKVQREKQRMDLKVTVGENVVRLSRLEGVNLELYQSVVLPALIKLIKKTKDHMSQQYLLDCIISAFPDEYHLHTLESILQTCTQGINPRCDVKVIFIRLMGRLADFAANSDQDVQEINKNINIFEMFKKNIDNIISNKRDGGQISKKGKKEDPKPIPINKLLELQVAFLKFTSYCYPQESDYVNQILASTSQICNQENEQEFSNDVQKNLVKLLTQPLESLGMTILTMEDYPQLMSYLPYQKRKTVATKICEAVVKLNQVLSNTKVVKQLLTFLKPLLTEEDENSNQEPYEFEIEQQLVARVVHLVKSENPKTKFKMLSLFKEQFLQGSPERQRFTLPACFFAFLQLAYAFKVLEEQGEDTGMDWEKYFTQCKDCITPLSSNNPHLTLKLFLQLQITADHCNLQQTSDMDEFIYDISSEPLVIYQDELSDTKEKKEAITLIVAYLNQMRNIGDDNFDTLVTNACQYGAKLLRKSDQCLAILMCTHLWLNQKNNSEDRIFECFKRCLKLAGISYKSNPRNIILYVHIINKMIYYLNNDVQTIGPDAIQQCLERIYSLAENIDESKVDNHEKMKEFLETVVAYIKQKKETNEQYAQIETG